MNQPQDPAELQVVQFPSDTSRVEDTVVVPYMYEDVLVCRDHLIKVAQSQQMITLKQLYDKLREDIPQLPARINEEEKGNWVRWLYGMLHLVSEDCTRRSEPLLTALVTLDNGSVW